MLGPLSDLARTFRTMAGVPGKGGPKGISDEAVTIALTETGGIIATAAQKLGVTRQALAERVRNSPELKASVQSIKKTVVDAAENLVLRAITIDRDLATAKWYLAQQGGERGYGNNVNVHVRLDDAMLDAIVRSFGGDVDALREFRRAIESPRPIQLLAPPKKD